MSYDFAASAVPAPPPKPRVLPPEVSNFVAAFWFAIGFAAVLLTVLWPEASGFLPAGLSNVVLFGVFAVLVAIGVWVTRGIVLGNQGALRVGKMVLLVGGAVGLVAVVGLLIVKGTGGSAAKVGGIDPPGFFGASPLLASALLGLGVLLPVLFAMLGFFMAMRDEVDAYFNPPPPEEELTSVVRPVVMQPEEAEGYAEETPIEAEGEALAAELEAQEAALSEGSGLESTGEGLSDSDKAAYDDAEAPLSMGELSLDDETPPEKKDE